MQIDDITRRRWRVPLVAGVVGLALLGAVALLRPVLDRGDGVVTIEGRTGEFRVGPAFGADLGDNDASCPGLQQQFVALVGELAASYGRLRTVAAERTMDERTLIDFSHRWRADFYHLKSRLFPLHTCASFRTAKAGSIRLWRDVSIYEKEVTSRLWQQESFDGIAVFEERIDSTFEVLMKESSL